MRGIFDFKAAWALAFVVFFYAFTVKVLPYSVRGIALRGLLMVLAAWGVFAYWRPFRRAIFARGWPDGASMYGIMVFVASAAYLTNITIAMVWRGSGQPAFLVNNALFDFWIVLAIVAMAIAVTVPDLFGRDVPPKDRIQLGAFWTAAVFVVLWLIVVQPDLTFIAEALRPMLDSGHAYLDPD